MTKKRFIFNDERVRNSYGFKIKTSGISLKRFEANPICLNDHENKTGKVLGTWQKLKTNQFTLSGAPKFDTEDVEGKEVVRKVNNGTIRGCSMGIFFNEKDLVLIDGELWLLKCELYEVSIVAVPSNANSIALYNEDGELLSDSDVQKLCLNAKKTQFKPNKIKMEELIGLLKLNLDADNATITLAVKKIVAELQDTKTQRDSYKLKFEELSAANLAKLKADFEAELELAVKDGRIDAGAKASILELADGKYDKGLDLLQKLPKRKSVEIEDKSTKLSNFDNMTWSELDKKGLLAKLKAEHKDYYIQRFTQEFGTEPKNV